jgi:membrane associated rhomboid family serine protease
MMPIRLTAAVKALIIACVAIFLFQLGLSSFGGGLVGALALIPHEFVNQGHLWQIITYFFLHTEPLQLVLNMMMIAFIGSELEAIWGTKRFVQFYFFCGVFSGIVYLVLQLILGGGGIFTPMLGASGAIYGLLAAYGILFKERVMLFMMLFPMKAKHFIWILAGVEFLSSLSSGRNGVGSLAHLGGIGAAYLYLYGRASWNVYVKRKGDWDVAQRGKRARNVKHLKLVKNDDSSKDPDKDRKTWH